MSQDVEKLLILRNLLDVLNVSIIELWLLFLGIKTSYSSSNDNSVEMAGSVLTHWGTCSENSTYLDSITRLDLINKIVLQDYLD